MAVLRLQTPLQLVAELLDLHLASQEHQDVPRRQLLMDLHSLLDRSFLSVEYMGLYRDLHRMFVVI